MRFLCIFGCVSNCTTIFMGRNKTELTNKGVISNLHDFHITQSKPSVFCAVFNLRLYAHY